MLKVNEKELIKSYKQHKKDIKLIKVLLKDSHARFKWCRKHKIKNVTECELRNSLALQEHELSLLEKFIFRD